MFLMKNNYYVVSLSDGVIVKPPVEFKVRLRKKTYDEPVIDSSRTYANIIGGLSNAYKNLKFHDLGELVAVSVKVNQRNTVYFYELAKLSEDVKYFNRISKVFEAVNNNHGVIYMQQVKTPMFWGRRYAQPIL